MRPPWLFFIYMLNMEISDGYIEYQSRKWRFPEIFSDKQTNQQTYISNYKEALLQRNNLPEALS